MDKGDILEVSRESALFNIEVSAEKMKNKRKWKYDIEDFNIRDRVLFRPDLDNNKKTRRMPLYDHIDTDHYIIKNKNNECVDIMSDKRELKDVHVSRLMKIKKN